MLNMNSLRKLYFLPEVHDMHFNADTIMTFIKSKMGRDPYQGDISSSC